MDRMDNEKGVSEDEFRENGHNNNVHRKMSIYETL